MRILETWLVSIDSRGKFALKASSRTCAFPMKNHCELQGPLAFCDAVSWRVKELRRCVLLFLGHPGGPASG